MIYTGLNRTGEVQVIHTHGGGTVGAVYGGINESNPIYYKTRTLTGTLPLSYKALGKPISDYLISGNTIQNGTPTPETPVDVVGCGVRTGNLLSSTLTRYEFAINSRESRIVEFPGAYTYILPTNAAEYFTLKVYNPGVTVGVIRLGLYDKPVPQEETIEYFEEAVNTENPEITIHNANNSTYLIIQIGSAYARQYGITGVMLNTGSTALPYEPYGYKLTVTCNGETKNIYIGNYPLNKSGNVADDVQYSTQMLTRRIDPETLAVLATPTTELIAVPQLPTTAGTNTLTVGTTVQPSEVSITGNIKEVST